MLSQNEDLYLSKIYVLLIRVVFVCLENTETHLRNMVALSTLLLSVFKYVKQTPHFSDKQIMFEK